jgi:hypothetical protein
MIARIIAAARKPTPKGGPVKNGRKPSLLPSQLSIGLLTKGTNTKIPHKPTITLGMAASISMMNETGPRSQPGESSTRNMAAPRLIGIAMTRANSELSNVPYMAGTAPY